MSMKTFKYASEVGLEKVKITDVRSGGRWLYKVRQKLKGQFCTIKASKPLILQRK